MQLSRKKIPSGITYENFIDLRELARCNIMLVNNPEDRRVIKVRKEIEKALNERGVHFSRKDGGQAKVRIEDGDGRNYGFFPIYARKMAEIYKSSLERTFVEENNSNRIPYFKINSTYTLSKCAHI